MGARGLQKAALVGILRGRYDIRLTDGGKAKKAAGMAVLRVGRGKASKMAALPQNGGAHAKEEEKPGRMSALRAKKRKAANNGGAPGS